MPFATLSMGIAEYQAGRFVVILDDEEDVDSQGSLAIAAEHVTPEAINFMAKYACGLICTPMSGKRLDELQIPLMTREGADGGAETPFAVSVEAQRAVTTGISAADRAATVRALIDPATRPEDLARPGHTFPLRCAEGGVLTRPAQAEAAVDLAVLAGLYPAAVICRILNEDGSVARLRQLERFAARHGLSIISVAQLVAYRRRHEKLPWRVAESRLPTAYGEFTAIAYASALSPGEHVALTLGDLTTAEPVLARIHDECLTGDVLGSLRCDCGAQLRLALRTIAAAGRGVLLYLRQEGRGIGLHNKVRAYALQDVGLDTVEANRTLGFQPDQRDYLLGAQILADLGAREVRLLTNNPHKVAALERCGLRVVERVPLVAPPNPNNARYLLTKRERMGHLLPGYLFSRAGWSTEAVRAEWHALQS